MLWTSQTMFRVGTSRNGSMKCAAGSGSRMVSEFSMPFQPRIDEPSNGLPSLSIAAVNFFAGRVTWWLVPRMSVKRRSTNSILFFLMVSKRALLMRGPCAVLQLKPLILARHIVSIPSRLRPRAAGRA